MLRFTSYQTAEELTDALYTFLKENQTRLYCEGYQYLHGYLQLTESECASVFEGWNMGELGGVLTEAFAKALRARLGRNAIEQDRTFMEEITHQLVAADAAIPADLLPWAGKKGLDGKLDQMEELRRALYAARLAVFTVGFSHLINKAEENSWFLSPAELAGSLCTDEPDRSLPCKIAAAYRKRPSMASLLLDDAFGRKLQEYAAAWNSVCKCSAAAGLLLPTITEFLNWFQQQKQV